MLENSRITQTDQEIAGSARFFRSLLAAGTAHGSAFQENVIKLVAYSSAPTGLISFALVLWGLRDKAAESRL